MNLALNPFDKGKRPEVINTVMLDQIVNDTIDHFNSLEIMEEPGNTWAEKFQNLKLPVLNASLIDSVYQVIKGKENSAEYISALINTSYEAGNNGFCLTCSGEGHVGIFLQGKSRRRLKLKIEGDVGIGFGMHTKYCDFIVNGDAGNCLGWYSKRCKFILNGDAGEGFGNFSEHSCFKANEVYLILGRASRNCTYEIDSLELDYFGGVNQFVMPHGCVFKVRDNESFEFLHEHYDGMNEVVKI
ncbi:hypothetical protein KY330_05795 [Candidatus Woesearchaeota archaeon]|nr:hypothetical protein [Candidatus Woesearchaeota archaeon]